MIPIFSHHLPLDYSKVLLEYFMFEGSGQHSCLLRILVRALKHTEKRCLAMAERQLFEYLMHGSFIVESMDEIPLTQFFSDAE